MHIKRKQIKHKFLNHAKAETLLLITPFLLNDGIDSFKLKIYYQNKENEKKKNRQKTKKKRLRFD